MSSVEHDSVHPHFGPVPPHLACRSALPYYKGLDDAMAAVTGS